jgi:hypothetical protein
MLVVVPTPDFDDYLRMNQAGEIVFIQAFIEKPSVETLHGGVSILVRSPGFDESQACAF